MITLTIAKLADAKHLPAEFLRSLGLRDTPEGIAIPYYDENGTVLFERTRLALDGDRRFHQPARVPLAPYGLDRLQYARSTGLVILVEGESDAWTLWNVGIAALGMPGASTARKLQREHLEEIRQVYVLREPGNGGDAFVKGLAYRLAELGFSGEAYEIALDGFKDPSDMYCDNPESFFHRFEKALNHATALQTDIDQATSLRVYSVQELLSLQLPPRDFVLDPIFRQRESMMIFSWRGVGKTLLGLSLAHAIATGGSCLNWRAPRPRRVLYIDGELPLQTLQERVNSLISSEYSNPDYLQFLTQDAQEHGLPDLGTREGQQALQRFIEPADVIFFDPLSTLMRKAKENEAEGWTPMQEYILQLRRAGKETILMHHEGKGGTQRGTSKREDILDTVIHLRRPSGYSPTEGARFEVHFEKCRAIVGESAKTFEARLDTSMTPATWSRHEIETISLTRATELFRLGMSVREVGDELGISKSAAHRLKQQLTEVSQRPSA